MIEHRLIERMVRVMEKQKNAIDSGSSPDHDLLDTAVDFIMTYADRLHHGKEEDLLFAKLRTKPMSVDMVQEMDRLIADHARSRQLIGRLKELNDSSRGGERSAAKDMIKVLGELVALYPDHISREDKQFFPAAMGYLQREESDALLLRFKEFDSKLMHERYMSVVAGAEKR